MNKEEADKIQIERDTDVGFSGTGGTIRAEQLKKWAYRRLESWPDLLVALGPFARLADMIPAPDAPDPQWDKFITAIRALPLDRYREARAAIEKAKNDVK